MLDRGKVSPVTPNAGAAAKKEGVFDKAAVDGFMQRNARQFQIKSA